MNKNRQSQKVFFVFIETVIAFGGLFSLLLGWAIDLYPEIIRQNVGDKVMQWLIKLPLPYISIVLFLVFVVIFIYLLSVNGVFEKKLKTPNEPSGTKNKQVVKDGSTGLQNPVFNAPVSFVQSESKKTEDNQEIVFHRTFYHKEFFILGATSEQVLNYIRNDISASLWYFYTADNFAYDVSHTNSKFYYPNKDNVAIHGAFFHGIKYELEKRDDEIKNRRNGVHIPELFWISIAPVGIGENVRLQVNFETQTKEAIDFFDIMKKRLVKMFKITDGVAGAW